MKFADAQFKLHRDTEHLGEDGTGIRIMISDWYPGEKIDVLTQPYDKAFLGVVNFCQFHGEEEGIKAVYSKIRVIDVLCQLNNWDRDTAREWLEYNIGSIYVIVDDELLEED